MNSKTTWIVIVSVIVILVVAGALYWSLSKDKTATDAEKAQQLQGATEALDNTPTVDIPSGNPIKQLAPSKNPLEVANPFKEGYQNPFE